MKEVTGAYKMEAAVDLPEPNTTGQEGDGGEMDKVVPKICDIFRYQHKTWPRASNQTTDF
jgi:hypothetical protein